MQVDGEACRLNPSIITLSFLNQAQMLAKCKGAKVNIEWVSFRSWIIERLELSLLYFKMIYDFNLIIFEACEANDRFLKQAMLDISSIYTGLNMKLRYSRGHDNVIKLDVELDN